MTKLSFGTDMAPMMTDESEPYDLGLKEIGLGVDIDPQLDVVTIRFGDLPGRMLLTATSAEKLARRLITNAKRVRERGGPEARALSKP
jgi:hypothetical protein